jgi:PhnB protein
MQITPYLAFNGDCEAAFRFYEKCLGGKITFMANYGGSPMENHVPAEWAGKIMHATLTVGDQLLQGADAMPGTFQKAQGLSVTLNMKAAEAADAERIFQALAEGGEVQMPIQETFWAVRFGIVTDRFGTPWMINCERPM